jgi:hypothetical protein
MGGETKVDLEALKLLFDEFNRFAEDAISIHLDCLPLLMTHKTDLSVGWKLRNKGGACKVKTDFCMYCPCLSDNVQEPVSPCDDCYALQKDQSWGMSDDTACYHYNLVDDLELKKIEVDRDYEDDQYGHGLATEVFNNQLARCCRL